MNVFNKIFNKKGRNSSERELYDLLNIEEYKNRPYQVVDLGEKMAVVENVVDDYWKPFYLLDNKAKKAFQIINENLKLVAVMDDDIDWDSLKSLSNDMLNKVHQRDARFPTMIRGFHNGRAEIEWQIQPDGMYFMDEDGYGMSHDEKIVLYGEINRNGKIVSKFKKN